MESANWIKVEDRLPDFEEDVLMYHPKDYFHQVYVGYYNGKEFRENEGSIIKPTHWMPIVLPNNDCKSMDSKLSPLAKPCPNFTPKEN